MPILPNPKHELFAQALAKGETADKAYVLAGYTENRHNAGRLKTNEHILRRIEELVGAAAEKAGVTVQRIIDELAKIGFANIGDYVDTSGSAPAIDLTRVTHEKLAALSEITTETVFERSAKGKPTEVRRIKIKLWDKKGALVDLGKHLGMFRDREQSSQFDVLGSMRQDAETVQADESGPATPIL